jgi:CheY-like chemotaxis protein
MDKTKILVVDDEHHVLQLIADVLHEYDVTLEPASLRAIEKIRDMDFDIIITDYRMPMVNGIEFLEVIKDEYKNKRYAGILCTAYGTTYLFEHEQQAGLFQFYLEKPMKPESIQNVITQAFNFLYQSTKPINNKE